MAERINAVNVGGSFWIAAKHLWTARWNAKRRGITILTREEGGGYRVWRRT